MIHIEQMRMHLPAGFEHRAASIARLVGEQLARQTVSHDAVLEHIVLSPLRLRADTADEEIARQITNQVIDNVAGGRR